MASLPTLKNYLDPCARPAKCDAAHTNITLEAQMHKSAVHFICKCTHTRHTGMYTNMADKRVGGRQTITNTRTHTHSGKWYRECKTKGNGQFVKSGKSGEADRTVGLKTMAEIKARFAKRGL